MKKEKLKTVGAGPVSAQKGITLIALVITIIVMLILVAVTITMAVNGGLFEYAGKAGTKTNEAIEKEQELANLEANMTVDELIDKFTGGAGEETIDWDTIVADLPTKYEEYLALAQAKGQVITGEEAEPNIGIGTDGEVVNLSLWHYYKTDDGTGMSLGKADGCEYYVGYDVENLDAAGKVQGYMPQYIYIKSENIVFAVTMLESTFYHFGNLKEIPELPVTVKYIGTRAFERCSGLTSVVIPRLCS